MFWYLLQGRQLDDIPRDDSGSDSPFFKLPLPDEGEEDYYADVIVSVGNDDEEVCKVEYIMVIYPNDRKYLLRK